MDQFPPGPTRPRLTSLAHGGGCGCKLSPAVLRDLLAAMPQTAGFPNLLSDSIALVATTDFFMPVVDDPYEFGRIAAANALSDIYAMGGTPVLALAVLGMPLGRIATGTVQRILLGGAAVCQAAGIPIAGGHSIDSPEPIYGLVALGTVHPDRVLRNTGARDGDALLLTKGLGVGIFSAALKQEILSSADYRTMIDSTTRLNAVGRDLAEMTGVHGVTDVTGFGLLGHGMEMCRGSGLGARIRMDDVPVLPGAAELARAGVGTGAAARNWASYGADIRLPGGLADWQRGLLCDPQTSGGLLISAAPAAVPTLLHHLRATGFTQAAEIGTMHTGMAGIDII